MHGDIELCRGQVKVVCHGWTFGFRRLKRFRLKLAALARFKKVPRDGRKQRKRQLIFDGGRRGGHILLELLQFRLQPVGRPSLDWFFIADRPRHHGHVERAWRTAVQPKEIVLGLSGNHLVALALFAGQHIQRRLRADDLAGRCDQRRVTHFFTDPRHFIEHFLHAVERILFSQLRGQIRQHAAGNLRGEDFRIHPGEVAFKLTVLSAHVAEVFSDRFELPQIQARIVWRIAQAGDHGFGRWMRSPTRPVETRRYPACPIPPGSP